MKGARVFYWHLHQDFFSDAFYAELEESGIRALSYEFLPAHFMHKIYDKTEAQKKLIYDRVLRSSHFENAIERHLQMNESTKQKFRLLCLENLQDIVTRKAILLHFADTFSLNPVNRVSVFMPPDLWTGDVLANWPARYENLAPSFAHSLRIMRMLAGALLRMPSRLIRGAARRIARVLSSLWASRQQASASPGTPAQGPGQEQAARQPQHCEVVYFPHQGIFYGKNLFLKDHYYIDEPGSCFARSSILHLSMNDPPAVRERSEQYYREHQIPHMNFLDVPVLVGYRKLRMEFVLRILRGLPLVNEWRKFRLQRVSFYFEIFILLRQHLLRLQALPNIRIALLGFDVMFSKSLAVALGIFGVTILASQERLLQAYVPLQTSIVDHYFVIGDAVKKQLESTASVIGKMTVTGPIRADLVSPGIQGPPDEKYAAIKKDYFLVLVADFHSEPSPLYNRIVDNNWMNNRKFYRDMIRLAIAFPGAYFAIKGKNSDVLSNPQFTDLIQLISYLPNIHVETDLDTYTPYKLATWCDACIAMVTSLGDEMLASGKKVLFYDYYGMPSGLHDYEGFPVLVYSYEELSSRLRQIIEQNYFMDPQTHDRMLKQVFGAAPAGTTARLRLQQGLRAYDRGSANKSQSLAEQV